MYCILDYLLTLSLLQEYVVNRLSIEIYVAEENVKIVVFALSLMQSQGNVQLSTNAKTYINRFKLPYFYCFRRKGESQKINTILS